MKPTALLFAAILASAASPALANEEFNKEWAKAMLPECAPLLTLTECRAHQAILARLPEGDERNLYMAQHIALLKDRVRLCECSRTRDHLSMLRY
jgi:hypothetical protein